MRKSIGTCLLVALTVALVWGGAWSWRRSRAPRVDRSPQPAAAPFVAATSSEFPPAPPRVAKFCGMCHRLPPPDCEPRDQWPQVIEQMYALAERHGPWPKAQLPGIGEVVEYYTQHAPRELTLPPSATSLSPLPLVETPLVCEQFPGERMVSDVQFVRLFDGEVHLLACEMFHGVVAAWNPARPGDPPAVLARVPHPGRATVVDLDQDGIRDLLIADLGVLSAADTRDGAVVWLRGQAKTLSEKGSEPWEREGQPPFRSGSDRRFEAITLIAGLGRVADVQAADFDGDGDLDLVVAVHGHIDTGCVLYAENVPGDDGLPQFEPRVLDNRKGALQTPVTDLNHDGRPDFVAVFGQEHETVVAFLNVGPGQFAAHDLYAAPHPRWGTTRIELVDWDADQDVDILFLHGDAFEKSAIPRPSHGVSWLENQGRLVFRCQRLAFLPGAHGATAGDLDGDRRSDVAIGAFMPKVASRQAAARASLIWLRRTDAGSSETLVVEAGTPNHPSVALDDFDGDGDLDLAAAWFVVEPLADANQRTWVSLWKNESEQIHRAHPPGRVPSGPVRR